MKVEVSNGELVDKYCILCIKTERIVEPEKKKHVSYEKQLLEPEAIQLIEPWKMFYELLLDVNQQIWDKTNDVKQMDVHHERYATLAHEIFTLNDQRFRLKRVFQSTGIKEQKSYAQNMISIHVPTDYGVDDVKKLSLLAMDYDVIWIQGCMPTQPLPACFVPCQEEEEAISIRDMDVSYLARSQREGTRRER